jgi:hypothetical protein
MEPTEILSTLKQLGITAQANGDKLVLTPGSMVPPDLVPVIQEHKAELIALLARVCTCEVPMPPADTESPACQHCGIACWCSTCGGCRWCSFEVKWWDYLEPKYQREK